jgi:hypothetical protein
MTKIIDKENNQILYVRYGFQQKYVPMQQEQENPKIT